MRAALSVSSILRIGVASHDATLMFCQSRRTIVSSNPFVVFKRFLSAPTTLYCSLQELKPGASAPVAQP